MAVEMAAHGKRDQRSPVDTIDTSTQLDPDLLPKLCAGTVLAFERPVRSVKSELWGNC